jgi:hypothetical protein
MQQSVDGNLKVATGPEHVGRLLRRATLAVLGMDLSVIAVLLAPDASQLAGISRCGC